MASHPDTSTDMSKFLDLCPIRHHFPPAYIRPNQDRPKLEFRKYKARDLLNCTVGSFFDVPEKEQSMIQLKAKQKFLKVFDHCMKLTQTELRAKGLLSTLTKLMVLLDDYFFFESLAKGSPPIIELRVCNFKDIQPAQGLCAYEKDADGAPRCVVSIAQDNGQGEPCSLEALVGTLLHEMVHAYLHGYVCNLSRCGRNHLNTTGVESSLHGPTFRALVYAVMVCMSGWRPALAGHFRDFTFGSYVEPYSFHGEKLHIEFARTTGRLDESLPLVRAPSHLHLIQIREDKIIIDSGRLRVHVKKYCAKPNPRMVASGGDADDGKKVKPAEQQDDEAGTEEWEEEKEEEKEEEEEEDPEASKNKRTIYVGEMKDRRVKFISSYYPPGQH